MTGIRSHMQRTRAAAAIAYGSTAPSSLSAKVGAVSPLGWPVDFYDDYSGTFARVHNAGWSGASRANPNSFTTGAKYVPSGANAVYLNLWNGAWGGYAGTDSINNVAMSGGDLIFNVTNVGGVITTSSVVMSFPSPWGLWEWNVKAAHGANGSRSGCNMGLWMSYYPWISGAEFDVIETAVGGGTSGGVQTTIHSASGDTATALFNSASLPNSTQWDDGNYHTFSALLTPAFLATYVDGVLMGSGNAPLYLTNVNTGTTPPNSGTQYTWGWHGNVIAGTPSSPDFSFSDNLYVLFGYQVTSGATVAVCPTSANVNWMRFSRLYLPTGGPHV